MPRRPLLFLPILVTLAACQRDTPVDDDPVTALQAGNTMTCISGAEKFSGQGDRVGVGSLGGDAKQLSLSLDLREERGGKIHVISSGLMAVPMVASTSYFPEADKEGGSGGSDETRTTDNDLIKDYNGGSYAFAYSDQQYDNGAKLKLEVQKFDQSVAPETDLPRYRIQGAFQFKVAHMPFVNGNLPEACSMEAIQRSFKAANGSAPRYPQYDVGICKAEKKHVDCRFDVIFDGLPSK